ncbi:MAG: Response regulator of zinc sigma-54-dependent two-component system [Myxococcaceae bacterium]|nr:Response regulator of zinc sigma-54-dependent two-component system [Myxococcaceae bacterium]
MHNLARYRVVRELGAGAAGGVYLVEDRVLGGPLLALKRIQAATDRATQESFAREFAVLASLSLAGVGRVHDLGLLPASDEAPAGPFFTRDYVEGQPLHAWARGRSCTEQVQVFRRVLEVLGQLHARAVLHGDLHPGNIIVDRSDAPQLIDFGLASQGTQLQRGAGTPLFMAPELLAGASSSMSADLYALGATFWAALSGTAPFVELGARALGAKLQGQLPSLGAATGAQRSLLEVLLTALAPDPRDRVPSADELCARLERAAGLAGAHRPKERAHFVAPRPRGRTELSERLAKLATDPTATRAITVLHGARGIGKSTLLRELKWRLQLEGAPVLEVRCREGVGSATAQLARQLSVLGEQAQPALPEVGHDFQVEGAARRDLCTTLAAALMREGAARYTLLVDDIDDEAGLFSEVLRALAEGALAEPRGRLPNIVVSSASLAAPGLAALVDLEPLSVGALDERDVRALIGEALGPLDESTVLGLLTHAEGNPGILLELLAWCWQRGDAELDLAQLSPGTLGIRLAEQQLSGLSVAARELLSLLALARSPLPEAFLAELFGDARAARGELLERRLVRSDAHTLSIGELRIGDYLRTSGEGGAGEQRARLAQRALERASDQAEATTLVELALVAGDRLRARSALDAALPVLQTSRARATAARLCEGCLTLGARDQALLLQTSELHVELGNGPRAAELAEELLAQAGLDPLCAARARIAAARAHVFGARLERAIERLSEVTGSAPAELQAQAARELSRVYLRSGEADRARAAIARGLAVARSDDVNRAELLAIEGTLLSQAGEHAAAATHFAQALQVAEAHGGAREQAQVLGYRALSHERRGALDDARADYEAGLQAARLAGDLGLTSTYALNLGNVGFSARRLEDVEQHYTLAARLSRRAGRVSTALLADTNLATLHVHLGSFARGRLLAEAALLEAERIGSSHSQAHALHVLADVEARAGQGETALARYEAAAARYLPLGRHHEAAEIWLDAAELLLDRGGVSDVSAGSAKVALARELIERHAHDDLRPRLRLLLARARAAHGDLEGAVKDLAELERGLQGPSARETLWQVLHAASSLHAQLGSSLLAARKAREAAELIELLASQVPREAREAFLAEPRRRAALSLARHEGASGPGQAKEPERPALGLDEPRFARLLELIKRLARERDLPRLLERITDAAVDLSGAERGFVLLVDATGQLAPHTVRSSGGAQADPHVAFSRSIAEAVLIDGEPIVTVNARDDRRLNEFMSVHKLMLKSVACIPISGPLGVTGVLYLEHRLRAGRFQEDDIDLLVAFADQAAIALENARLWSENLQRSHELEAQARELATAKGEIERLLEARTEELEQVRRDLGRARAELECQHSRHGIVGQSAPMRRVFALIDRVADSPVPVVVEGESGTGKELVARAIHFGGARKKEPFVALNCAALPEHLLESELFGHVRGAFTGAERDKRGLFSQAQGGTLFLDEFADMSPRMQLDLLRVLQERCIRPVGGDSDIPIDVRIIAASNRPLKQLVASGRLREDLYYRMSVVEIKLPALRERSEDIPLLCDHLLARIGSATGTRPRKLSRAALERLIQSELPGNVRQLEHMLTSASMMAEGPLIEPVDLALDGPLDDDQVVGNASSAAPPLHDDAALVLPGDVQGFKTRERRRILDALEQHGWNRAKAATALGMPRRTFYRRLSEFNIL